MPKIFREDLMDVFDHAKERFQKSSGKSTVNMNTDAFFIEFAAAINKRSSHRLRSRWLHREVYIKYGRHEREKVIINVKKDEPLNALVCYRNDRNDLRWSELYPWGVSEKDLLVQQAVFRVKADKQFTSDQDIGNPQFPVGDAAYPATPHIKLNYKDFTRLWLKDESFNVTGTHKDRLGWEITDFFSVKLAEYYEANPSGGNPPVLSFLSSGCAVTAVQHMLKTYGLPSVKLLYDEKRFDKKLLEVLETSFGLPKDHMVSYTYDEKPPKFSSEEILQRTNNEGGIDITFGTGWGLEKIKYKLYDWLSYEILNLNPEYCIIPFGSGNLYRNILEIAKGAQKPNGKPDRRFFGSKEILNNCTFLGATSKFGKIDTVMDKLYTPYNSFKDFDLNPYSGYINENSRIIEVDEEFAKDACILANQYKIECEPSGIAGLGLLLQIEDDLPRDKRIVIVNTGKLKF